MICRGRTGSQPRPFWRSERSASSALVALYGFMLWIIMAAVSAARPVHYIVPTFMNTPNNVTAVVGTDVHLPCSVENLGPKSVIWRKLSKASPISIGDYVFDPDKHYSVTRSDPYTDPRINRFSNHRYIHENPVWNLLVKDVNFSHAGTYQCQISIKEDMVRNITLNVVDGSHLPFPPPSHPVLSPEDRSARAQGTKSGINLRGSMYVEKGDLIDLNCTATSLDYRPKGLDWFKDGTRLKTGERRLITDKYIADANVIHSRLEIQRATMTDAGTYVCRFSEDHVQSIKVNVLNKNLASLPWPNKLANSSNKRRGTGTEGLQVERSKDPRDQDYGESPGDSQQQGSDRDTASITSIASRAVLGLCLVLAALALT